jgi:glutamate synthase domain-containing protein 3
MLSQWEEYRPKFVKVYPKSEDTADAMLQLGMVCEFLGKEVEAKNWYAQLAKNFADKPRNKADMTLLILALVPSAIFVPRSQRSASTVLTAATCCPQLKLAASATNANAIAQR